MKNKASSNIHNNKQTTKVLIIGNGAVGMFISCCLSSFNKVSAILCARRADAVKCINERGIRVNYKEKVTQYKIRAGMLETLSDEFISSVSLIILCIKSTQIDQFIRGFPSQRFNKIDLLTLQNGMGYTEKLLQKIPIRTLSAGVNTYGITKIDDNTINQAGEGRIHIGTYHNSVNDGEPKKQSKDIAEMLSQSGLNAIHTKEILKELWAKLCVNACINTITALIGRRNGALLDLYALYEPILNKLCEEIADVANAEGIEVQSLSYKEKVLEVIQNTKVNKSSMLQDVEARRETEIDYINGYIIRKGKEHHINTDACELLYRLMKMKT